MPFSNSMNTVQQSDEFKEWFRGLRDQIARAKILVRINVLPMATWVTRSTSTVSVSYASTTVQATGSMSPRKKNTMYLLLCGGDKSSQQKDIARAKKMLAANSSPG